MAFYKIGNLIIEIDIVANNYQPFLCHDISEIKHIDLKIRRTKIPHSTKHFIKWADLPEMVIWKRASNVNDYMWLYEAKNGICTIAVSEEYAHAEYYYLSKLDSLNINLERIISPYFQIIIECRMISAGFSVLHSACVELSGAAYAFTGPSGIGKSSRARKWCELFSAEWLSGDRPAIDAINGIAYGVPWDGKEAIYRNINYPLMAILKVERSKNTQIRKMSKEEKMRLLCEQTFFPMWDTDLVVKLLNLLSLLIEHVDILELRCDITNDSIIEAHDILLGCIKKAGGNDETKKGV